LERRLLDQGPGTTYEHILQGHVYLLSVGL
jgi:hypothetical protein